MEAGSWQFICGADLFDSHGRFAYHQDMANCTKETMQVFGRSIRLADMVQDLYCIYIYTYVLHMNVDTFPARIIKSRNSRETLQ